MARRSTRWLTPLAAVAALAGCGGASDAVAGDGEPACAAPVTLTLETTVAPGDALEVTATNLVAECYDQGEGIAPEPLQDQPVTWRQAGETIELAVVDAQGGAGTAEVTVTVPMKAEPGTATISVGDSEAAEVTVAP